MFPFYKGLSFKPRPHNKQLMRIYLLALSLSLLTPVFSADDYIDFQRLDLMSDQKKWLVATVQFSPKEHPNPKEALNEKFIDDVKVSIHLCFKNVTREKKIFRDTRRRPELPELLDYYHAEVEIPTIEVDGRPKSLSFLFPLEIAKRDGFDRVQKPFGYVVEISIGDTPLELEEPIVCEISKQENVLKSFKDQALSKSTKNEGLLLPAHLVDISYMGRLENAPAVKFPEP